MAKKTKQASGGKRLGASGKKPILLGATREEWAVIHTVAKHERRPMTQYILHHIMELAAKTIAEKNLKIIPKKDE